MLDSHQLGQIICLVMANLSNSNSQHLPKEQPKKSDPFGDMTLDGIETIPSLSNKPRRMAAANYGY